MILVSRHTKTALKISLKNQSRILTKKIYIIILIIQIPRSITISKKDFFVILYIISRKQRKSTRETRKIWTILIPCLHIKGDVWYF